MSTLSARDAILKRIREKSGKRGVTSDVELEAVRRDIAAPLRGPLPKVGTGEPVSRFLAECDRLTTSFAEVSGAAAIPAEVARYLDQAGLARRVVGWHEFAALDWTGAGIAFDDRPANGEDLTGLTGCFCAIGETGTLVLLGAAATPKATALLPETHLCVVRRERIVATMEDAFALMRAEVGEPPRALFMVSGPSRTADIEQTLVIGAHGPYRVHAILV